MGGIEVAWLLEKLWVVIFPLVIAWKRGVDRKHEETQKSLNDLNSRIEALVAEDRTASLLYLTPEKAEVLINKELEKYKDDQKEVKVLLKGLGENLIGLSKEVAIQQAIGSINENKG